MSAPSVLDDLTAIKAARERAPNPNDLAIPSERSAAQRRLVVLDGVASAIGKAHQRFERAQARLATATEAVGTLRRQRRELDGQRDAAGAAMAREPSKNTVQFSLLQRQVENLQAQVQVLDGELELHETFLTERQRDFEQAERSLKSARQQRIGAHVGIDQS